MLTQATSVLVLSDKNDANHPVSFFSRKLNVFSTIEQEALALLSALQLFEVDVRYPRHKSQFTPQSTVICTKDNEQKNDDCLDGA